MPCGLGFRLPCHLGILLGVLAPHGDEVITDRVHARTHYLGNSWELCGVQHCRRMWTRSRNKRLLCHLGILLGVPAPHGDEENTPTGYTHANATLGSPGSCAECSATGGCGAGTRHADKHAEQGGDEIVQLNKGQGVSCWTARPLAHPPPLD